MRPFRSGPIALTTTTTANLLNVPTTTGGTNAGTPILALYINQIHVVNKGSALATFSLWLGATGANTAGTELYTAVGVPVGGYFNDYFVPNLRMVAADFLVGGASANTTLTMVLTGTIGVVA